MAAHPSQTTAPTPNSAFRGLGYLDSRHDVLTLEFTVQVVHDNVGIGEDESKSALESAGVADTPHARRHAKRDRAKHRHKLRPPEEKTITVQLAQDTTALHSRKGDTGSVLWRACTDFAQMVLRRWYARATDSLFDRARLSQARVVELGAGTGLLSILLSPIVRHYTVTDIAELVPLLSKNLTLNNIPHSKPRTAPHSRSQVAPTQDEVRVDALDWLTIHNAPPAARHTLLDSYAPLDLILVVDCIYHPSLLPPLVTTIDALAERGRTVVVVVVELRAEDVIREFLELWLRAGHEGEGSGDETWEIWHANIDELLDGPYAVWVGWKKPPDKETAWSIKV
ncbi:hypothetical protein EIP86_009116 [Pleurotus ostreatoroseus]|nr:hypothetical protein EIP86_009116 [Pleurotus ostreatoroseus]